MSGSATTRPRPSQALITRPTIYNDYEAPDPKFLDEVCALLEPAFKAALELARSQGVRLREVTWLASDLINVMGSEAILRAALRRAEGEFRYTDDRVL